MKRLCHLYLERQRLSAWQQHKGKSVELASFPENPEGLADFSAFLAVHRKNHFALLVNLADESFARETLPKLRHGERRQLLETRSRRLFPDTPWRCASAFDTGNSGKNDHTDHLLMALANPASLSPWLERLNAADAALESVHSLPQLLPALMRQHMAGNTSLLTLSLHENAVRFSLLLNGQLHNSRLASLGSNITLSDEYRRFVEHINRQQPLDPLPPLCIIADPAQQAEINLPGIVRRINAPASNSASLFLAIPPKQWPREQFAPATQCEQARQRQQITWTWRAAALVCLIGTGISLERLNQHQAVQRAIQQEQQLHQDIDNKIQHNDQALALSGLSRQQLQQLALDYPKLQDKHNTFEAGLLTLSRALDDSPAIELDRIDWKIDGFPPSTATIKLVARVQDSDRRKAEALFRQFQNRLEPEHSSSLLNPLPAIATASGFPFVLQLTRQARP